MEEYIQITFCPNRCLLSVFLQVSLNKFTFLLIVVSILHYIQPVMRL